MANTIEDFDLTVASQLILDEVKVKLLPLNAFTIDGSAGGQVTNDELRKGKTVHVALLNESNDDDTGSGDFNASTQNYEDADDRDIDTVAVALTQHKKTTFTFSDAELELLANGVLSKTQMQHARKLGRLITTDVQSLLTTGNFANEDTVLASAFDFDELITQRKFLVDQGLNMDDGTFVANSAYYANLLQDTTAQDLIANQTNEAYREANIGRLAQVDIIEVGELTATENLAGFITDKTGIVIAGAELVPARGMNVAENIVNWSSATDPLTGLTIGVRAHYEPASGTAYMTYECVYGRSVGRANAINRLVTS